MRVPSVVDFVSTLDRVEIGQTALQGVVLARDLALEQRVDAERRLSADVVVGHEAPGAIELLLGQQVRDAALQDANAMGSRCE